MVALVGPISSSAARDEGGQAIQRLLVVCGRNGIKKEESTKKTSPLSTGTTSRKRVGAIPRAMARFDRRRKRWVIGSGRQGTAQARREGSRATESVLVMRRRTHEANNTRGAQGWRGQNDRDRAAGLACSIALRSHDLTTPRFVLRVNNTATFLEFDSDTEID